MFAYRTPGVYFEWLDTRPRVIGPWRTDIAGFVGIAARGPLHRPVKVESWTQFTSTFGGHIPQGYLAYAVEGFFANGGQTCWVVRVADPELARPASLDLLDGSDQPTLRLTASSPGVWGQDVTVSVARSGKERFSLTLRLADGGQELWRNLTMHQPDPRYVETVLSDPRTGSRLVTVSDLDSPTSFPGNTPSPRAPNLRAGSGRLAGGQDGLAPSIDLLDGTGQPTLRVTAASPGTYGQNVTVSVAHSSADRFSLILQSPDGREEEWLDLTMDQADPRYVETVLNDRQTGSYLVTVCDLHSPAGFPGNRPEPGTRPLAGGLSLSHLSGIGALPDKRWGLATLEAIDEVSIVVIPDIMPKPLVSVRRKERRPRCDVLDGKPALAAVDEAPLEFPPRFDAGQVLALQYALIGHCEKLKDRVTVLDPRIDDITPDLVAQWRQNFDTRYAALYYPWLMVPDPLRLEGLLRAVPPSGHVAGVYARVDQRVGVHKPPANEVVEGTKDVLAPADDIAHGDLNDRGVNVIRPYNGRGVRVAGARTLSSDTEWRFVNVRRLLIMIEEAIDEGTRWTVFEPNNPDLWRDVDRVARSFLDGLWRRGMLDGATAEEAYFVRCDETTNPPEETENGRMICSIGVQPPWPAEFVIVRIGKTEGGTEILEATEV
jgi:phage tail sheath protein FI